MADSFAKWMQGKSCFNFKKLDEELFRDLAALTGRAFDHFVKEGIIR
jgi:hypothetical protein